MLKNTPDTNAPSPRKPYREPKLTIYGNLQRLTMAKNKTNKESGVAGPPNTHS
jgi:hypothetical protein